MKPIAVLMCAVLLASCTQIPVARTYTLETPLGRASVRFEPPTPTAAK